jgi:hypothetical protein
LSPTAQGVNETNWELNRLLFGHSDEAFYADEKAEHVLEVTVKEVTGDQVCLDPIRSTCSITHATFQMFVVDYLTFEGTPWTNVAAPGKALASPLPEPKPKEESQDSPGGTRKSKVAFGLPCLALALAIGVGLL